MRWGVLGLYAAMVGTACIIPDREIQIETGIGNLGAVRIVQRAPLLPEMRELCNAAPNDPNHDPTFCPEVRASQASGLVRPASGDFCICPGGDLSAIPTPVVYAEDADGPSDTVYGVVLLDPDPLAPDPSGAMAYQNYWEPGRPGVRLAAADNRQGDRTAPPVGRPSQERWAFVLDDASGSGTIDLCNDDNGAPLPVGLHDLQVMVTDRPFFRPRRPVADEPRSGLPAFGPTQFGVPDLANGATYAVIDYVFECRDPADPNARCNCNPTEGS